ncbi:MAG: hypothetical protein WA678_08620 [Rhabdochlamydiaceae bacterium]|jgi:hypothetical protein
MEIKTIQNPTPLSFPQNHTIEEKGPQPFISALLYLKELLRELCDSATSFDCYGIPSSVDPNTFHFAFFLRDLEDLKEEGLFLAFVQNRRDEIHEQKEHFRPFIEELKKGKDRDFYSGVESALRHGKLLPISSGCGGAYAVVDDRGTPCYVVKPVDEDVFCLNNRKELGSVFNDVEHRFRDDIPLYRTAQIDAFCSEVASLAGLEETTPKTVIGILNEDKFYDLTRRIDGEEKEKFIALTGSPDKEKLSSMQEFVPHSRPLDDLLHEFYKEGLSDEEIASRFDQKDFEQVCMFLWLTYDNDAHGGNFLSFVKRVDGNGKKIYGIKKIDNGLSFPEKNTLYTNILTWAPNAILPISAELKQKISHLPVEQILKRMDAYELSDCKEAFNERVGILKELSQREEISIGEIDLRLSFLSREGGKELALSPLSTQEILDLLTGENTTETQPSSTLHETT